MGLLFQSEKDKIIEKQQKQIAEYENTIRQIEIFLRDEQGIYPFGYNLPDPFSMLRAEEEMELGWDIKEYQEKYKMAPTVNLANKSYDLRKSYKNKSIIKTKLAAEIILRNIITIEYEHALSLNMLYRLFTSDREWFWKKWKEVCKEYKIPESKAKDTLEQVIYDANNNNDGSFYINQIDDSAEKNNSNEANHQNSINKNIEYIFEYFRHNLSGCYEGNSEGCKFGLSKEKCKKIKNRAIELVPKKEDPYNELGEQDRLFEWGEFDNIRNVVEWLYDGEDLETFRFEDEDEDE